VSPLYLDGKVEFGLVAQSVPAFTVVVNAFSIMVQNFGKFSTLAAVSTRLGSFWEALEQPSSQTPNSDSSRGIVTKLSQALGRKVTHDSSRNASKGFIV
jgi:putative ATP-binding cassette transporter